jgi:hypothetical protein
MKIKMFEEFDAVAKKYLFFVIDDGVDFKAEVRNEDGKVIYTIDKEKMDKGIMSSPTDLSTLREFLIKKKKIQQIDELTYAESI